MPKFFATSAKGIEAVTAAELTRLGAHNVEAQFGGVSFEGDLEMLYKANLWLRTATRVFMPLREFAAKTPEMLYDQVRRIKWEQVLNPDLTFAIDCTISGQKSLKRGEREPEPAPVRRGQVPLPKPLSAREQAARDYDRRMAEEARARGEGRLNNSMFAALKIKDAIVDELRQKQGARPNVDTHDPDVRIVAYLHDGRCMISLDSSGASLHERGYRLDGAKAPLKETLAAAIIELSEWDPNTPFVDPMCGSGTLPLEAALKSLDIAPGLFRERFGFFSWPDFDKQLWERTWEAARARAKHKPAAPIAGFDADRDAIADAVENARRAGLGKAVHFEKREVSKLVPLTTTPGTLIVNPPYGERLGDLEELKGLYKLLGDLFKQRMKGYRAFIFTGNLELAKSVGLRASRRIELFNGPLDCRLLRYEMY